MDYGGPGQPGHYRTSERLPRRSLVLFVLAVVGTAAACNRPSSRARLPIASAALRGSNVLLITIDTLRADRVGALRQLARGDADARRVRRQRLRFERTYSHVPLTLPSHASLLTASYPTRNGVHDNGTFRLGDRRRPSPKR